MMAEKPLSMREQQKITKEWLATMPNRLESWLENLSQPLQSQLDLTPDSVLPLQHYLWERYDDYQSLYTPENREKGLCAAYYFGELMRKHMPIKLEWVATNFIREDDFSCPMFLKNYEYLNCSASPLSDISTAIIERDESHLEWRFKIALKGFQSAIDKKEFNFIFSIRLDDNYQFFLLHKTDTNPLSQIKTLLENYFSTRDNPPKLSYYRDSEDYLIVEMSDEYCFHFKFKSGDWTKESIERMANEKYTGGLDKKAIAQCQSTTEFWGDQDNNMDYINESLWLLEHLGSKLPDLVSIVDLKNGGEIFP